MRKYEIKIILYITKLLIISTFLQDSFHTKFLDKLYFTSLSLSCQMTLTRIHLQISSLYFRTCPGFILALTDSTESAAS